MPGIVADCRRPTILGVQAGEIKGKRKKRNMGQIRKNKRGHRAPFFYLIPNNFPTLLRLPLFVVGIPVAFAILRFAFVIPKARFQLNDRPGMPDFFFFAIFPSPFCFSIKKYSAKNYWQNE